MYNTNNNYNEEQPLLDLSSYRKPTYDFGNDNDNNDKDNNTNNYLNSHQYSRQPNITPLFPAYGENINMPQYDTVYNYNNSCDITPPPYQTMPVVPFDQFDRTNSQYSNFNYDNGNNSINNNGRNNNSNPDECLTYLNSVPLVKFDNLISFIAHLTDSDKYTVITKYYPKLGFFKRAPINYITKIDLINIKKHINDETIINTIYEFYYKIIYNCNITEKIALVVNLSDADKLKFIKSYNLFEYNMYKSFDDHMNNFMYLYLSFNEDTYKKKIVNEFVNYITDYNNNIIRYELQMIGNTISYLSKCSIENKTNLIKIPFLLQTIGNKIFNRDHAGCVTVITDFKTLTSSKRIKVSGNDGTIIIMCLLDYENSRHLTVKLSNLIKCIEWIYDNDDNNNLLEQLQNYKISCTVVDIDNLTKFYNGKTILYPQITYKSLVDLLIRFEYNGVVGDINYLIISTVIKINGKNYDNYSYKSNSNYTINNSNHNDIETIKKDLITYIIDNMPIRPDNGNITTLIKLFTDNFTGEYACYLISYVFNNLVVNNYQNIPKIQFAQSNIYYGLIKVIQQLSDYKVDATDQKQLLNQYSTETNITIFNFLCNELTNISIKDEHYVNAITDLASAYWPYIINISIDTKNIEKLEKSILTLLKEFPKYKQLYAEQFYNNSLEVKRSEPHISYLIKHGNIKVVNIKNDDVLSKLVNRDNIKELLESNKNIDDKLKIMKMFTIKEMQTNNCYDQYIFSRLEEFAAYFKNNLLQLIKLLSGYIDFNKYIYCIKKNKEIFGIEYELIYNYICN